MAEARSRFLAVTVLAAWLPALGGPALAQGSGEVDGHVQDEEGQSLAGVSVKLLKAGKGASQQQTSDAQGDFHFTGLASGVYIAAASREGYAEVTCPGVRVMSGLTRRLAIKLMPAEGEQPSSCEAVVETVEPPPEPPPPPPPGR
jgi:carboxypeptidase family protein